MVGTVLELLNQTAEIKHKLSAWLLVSTLMHEIKCMHSTCVSSQQLVSVFLCNPQVLLHLYKPYIIYCGDEVLSSSTAGPPPTSTPPTGKCV